MPPIASPAPDRRTRRPAGKPVEGNGGARAATLAPLDPSVRLGCRLCRDITSTMLDVPAEDLVRATRSYAGICQARHVAMYLAHIVFQLPLSSIAVDFGRDRTSVAHAVRRIEDQRDDQDFDALLTRLERLAGACRAILPGHAALEAAQ